MGTGSRRGLVLQAECIMNGRFRFGSGGRD